MKIFKRLLVLLASAIPVATHAWTADEVQIHAFVSQGFLHTWDVDYLVDSEEGSFQFQETGVNFSTELTEKLWVGVQLFGRRLGERANNKICVDWAIGDYQQCEHWGVRIGKIRQPVGLYNEVRDVDAARTFIFLPPSIYPESNREYFHAFLGLSVYGDIPVCCWGTVSYDFFLGTLEMGSEDYVFRQGYAAATEALGAVSFTGELTIPRWLYGTQVFFTPSCWEEVKVGVTATRSAFEVSLRIPSILLPTVEYSFLEGNFITELLLFSFEWCSNKWCIAAEYGIDPFKSWVSVDFPAAFPLSDIELNSNEITEAYYILADYRINDCFKVGGYYSMTFLNRDLKEDHEKHTRDYALTLRCDINDHFIFKLEGHKMHGLGIINSSSADAGGFVAALLGGSATPGPHQNWWLFAAKASFTF